MRVTGRLKSVSANPFGKLTITFEVNERSKAIEELAKIQNAELTINAEKVKEKRSLNANAYFWQLVDKIAKVLKSEKWTIYLLQLSKYGVFTDLMIPIGAKKELDKVFRYIEILDEDYETQTLRCYTGSSEYDRKQMYDLIEGTVQDAKDLGIETLTPRELGSMIASWKPSKNSQF